MPLVGGPLSIRCRDFPAYVLRVLIYRLTSHRIPFVTLGPRRPEATPGNFAASIWPRCHSTAVSLHIRLILAIIQPGISWGRDGGPKAETMAEPISSLRCQNCDTIVGKLETPHVFQGAVVCAPCHQRLWSTAQSAAPVTGNAPEQSTGRILHTDRIWTIHDQGHQFGPHTEQELATMLAVGTISRDALVWKEGSPRWIPVSNIVPLPPSFADIPVATPIPSSLIVNVTNVVAESTPTDYEAPPPSDLDYLAAAAARPTRTARTARSWRSSSGISCNFCGRGTMRKRKAYRMSPVVVIIGYIILIPSVVCMIIGAAVFAAGLIGANLNHTQPEVPETTLALGLLGGSWICYTAGCLVSGLLGWLLVMKKTVLKCSYCGAVVAAS
jgi:hypothetical protein